MSNALRGAEQLEALGRRLKAAGGNELRKELLRGIRGTTKHTIAEIRDSARDELPHAGGLAERVASGRITARTRLSGRGSGVTLIGSGGRLIRNYARINDGMIRHPVFARAENRKHWTWVAQAVEPGFFTKPVEEDLPHIRDGIEHVMRDVAAKIEG